MKKKTVKPNCRCGHHHHECCGLCSDVYCCCRDYQPVKKKVKGCFKEEVKIYNRALGVDEIQKMGDGLNREE